MSVAELLGSLTLETQIIVAGLLFLVFMLSAVQIAYMRSIRAREAAQSERVMSAQISRVVSMLEDNGRRGANGRMLPAVARFRPVKRAADRKVPAARCPANPSGKQGGGRGR
ncbi:MAG: hypothetical protein LPK88_00595 [Alphaproteobacteria bacterium]|nr:hypothetical protein [Alphaproteobacteria bacterium]MDX5414806.1 hypothetical protein [Alphaproteobacteria bacterium]MDX5491990.1 hypothetical protein [Alphaproteobacteria bacterium]